jgi:beta-glucosidase
LFPFGYGLSYTTFEYSNLKLASDMLTVGGELLVTVDLKNTGRYDGVEVVQLYIQDKIGSVTRPVKELKAFRRVALKAGESMVVSFSLPVSELAFWGYDMTYGVEPGDFRLWVGTSSAEGLSADFTVAAR